MTPYEADIAVPILRVRKISLRVLLAKVVQIEGDGAWAHIPVHLIPQLILLTALLGCLSEEKEDRASP